MKLVDLQEAKYHQDFSKEDYKELVAQWDKIQHLYSNLGGWLSKDIGPGGEWEGTSKEVIMGFVRVFHNIQSGDEAGAIRKVENIIKKHDLPNPSHIDAHREKPWSLDVTNKGGWMVRVAYGKKALRDLQEAQYHRQFDLLSAFDFEDKKSRLKFKHYIRDLVNGKAKQSGIDYEIESPLSFNEVNEIFNGLGFDEDWISDWAVTWWLRDKPSPGYKYGNSVVKADVYHKHDGGSQVTLFVW
jgi:hypothetical protein